MAEFGVNHPGTVYYDPETDTLIEVFQKKRYHYFETELNGEIPGGSGIHPTDGLPHDTYEPVKM